jgi:hypothetical protein
MARQAPGASVYLSPDDIHALHCVHGQLYTQREASAVDVPDLDLAMAGVMRLLDKIARAQKASHRRQVRAKALKIAEEMLAKS